jgi:hypothetical protein
MENKAGFYLNKALQDWKAELASQPGISAENIRELETHLLESITAFRKSGSSDEDAFSKARQKLGPAPQLGAEFAKENLLKVWRDRVFWITAVAFLLQLITLATHPVFENIRYPGSAHLVSSPQRHLRSGLNEQRPLRRIMVPLLVSDYWIALALVAATPPLLAAIAMATGFAEILFRRFHWIFSDRWRFAATGVIAILAATFAASNSPDDFLHTFVVINAFAFLGFAVFIWPRELAIVPATSGSTLRRNSIGLWRDRMLWVVLAMLAIRIWTLVPQIAAVELIRFNGRRFLPHLWHAVALESLLFLPMAIVGLALASARLSSLAQWLRTRSRVGFVAGVLVLIWIAQVLWLSDWVTSARNYPPATLLTGITVSVGLIAITLWTMPSHAGRPQGDLLKFD